MLSTRIAIGLLGGLSCLPMAAGADWQRLAARFPQANAVVESYQAEYEVAADGRYRSSLSYRATVLRDPGRAELASYSDAYCDQYDQVTVTRAAVIGPDGQEATIDPAAIKHLPMPADGQTFLPHLRLLLVSFPRLEVGTSVELRVESRRNRPPMDHAFSLAQPLQGALPSLYTCIQVTVPATMPLAWQVHRGAAACSKRETEGRVTWRWEVGELPPISAEPGMPPLAEIAPLLAVSTIPSWRDISRWYAALAKDSSQGAPALEELARSVTAGLQTREARVRALHFWVAAQIRYVETTCAGDKAGFSPAPASQTLARRYGVCRDKAQLLVTLLRAIGLEAHPALITSGIRQDVAIPVLQFNHAIVALRDGDGSFSFLDPTAADSSQVLPWMVQDRFALVCTEAGEDIQTTPLAPASENRMDITAATTLEADGSLRSDVLMEASGIHDLLLRQNLKGLSPAERENAIAGILAAAIPGAQLSQLRITGLDEPGAWARIAFSLRAPAQGIQAGPYLVFTSPGQGGCLDPISAQLLAAASAAQRVHPLALAATVESRLRETIQLPQGFVLRSHPESLEVSRGAAGLQRSCQPVAGGLLYTETLAVTDRVFAGQAYQDLRTVLDQRGRLGDGKLILIRGEVR